ncbi:GspH/FimT family pseudopilin [Alishewanella sp. SMS9]|nr:GspH/FimT family pseudopilin [Alishewanella sp. SMS9]
MQSNQLTGQINQLVGALSAARTEAIKMNQNVVFCHSSDGATCSDIDDGAWQGWLIGLAPTDQSAGIVAGSMMATGFLQTGQLILRANNNIADADSQVRFSPQGLVRTTNGRPLNGVLRVCINNSNDNNTRDLIIRSGGHIAVDTLTLTSCTAP